MRFHVVKGVFPLLRQPNDSDLGRQRRMKSEPLNPSVKEFILTLLKLKRQLKKELPDVM